MQPFLAAFFIVTKGRSSLLFSVFRRLYVYIEA